MSIKITDNVSLKKYIKPLVFDYTSIPLKPFGMKKTTVLHMKKLLKIVDKSKWWR